MWCLNVNLIVNFQSLLYRCCILSGSSRRPHDLQQRTWNQLRMVDGALQIQCWMSTHSINIHTQNILIPAKQHTPSHGHLYFLKTLTWNEILSNFLKQLHSLESNKQRKQQKLRIAVDNMRIRKICKYKHIDSFMYVDDSYSLKQNKWRKWINK